MSMKRKLAKAFGLAQLSLVELPGIEPGAKIDLNWDNSGIDDAKQRQTTRNDLRIR